MKRLDIETDRQVWLTSDTHFGHANIIKYCQRPFSSVEEMDETMIARWNAVVGAEDVVLHLGDFAYKTRHGVEEILGRLSGRVYLVMGNHDDRNKIRRVPGFAGVGWDYNVDGIVSPTQHLVSVNGVAVCVVSHYPSNRWAEGLPLFFGHVHTSHCKAVSTCAGSYDVGVDQNGFAPIRLEEALELAKYTIGPGAHF